MKKKIGFDFDGVCSDCGKVKSLAARHLYGVYIAPEKFKKEFVIDGGILTAAQYDEVQELAYASREVGLLMEPVPGFLTFLPRLIEEGHEITIITSRSEAALQVAKEWMDSLKLTLEFIRVGKETKVAAAKEKNLQLFVDDDLDKLEPLVGIVPHLFLFSWPYNHAHDASKIGKRVGSWEELYWLIQVI